MRRKLVSTLGAVVIAAVIGAAPAAAHPVGAPGEANCHGVRVSHGSSDHDQTPVDRVEELNDLLSLDPADLPPGFAAFVRFLQDFFGEEATVQEFHRFVRMNCEV
jgi:hypothetical protein